MRIVVSELPVQNALGRARARFRAADARLSEALAGACAGMPWTAGGALSLILGAAAFAGVAPLADDAVLVAGIGPLVLGGACLAYGLPTWSRVRRAKRERTREWHHARELLRLREQQAMESPEMTVEVLDRIDGERADGLAGWHRRASVGSRYVQ